MTTITFLTATLGVIFVLWGLAAFYYFSFSSGPDFLQLGGIEMSGFGLLLSVSFGLITASRIHRIKRQKAIDRAEYRGHR